MLCFSVANFCSKYAILFDSASDVFSLISPPDSELRALCKSVVMMSLMIATPICGNHVWGIIYRTTYAIIPFSSLAHEY